MSVSREEVEQIKEWAIAAASGHLVLIEEPAEKVALICCQLLAQDDALKQVRNSFDQMIEFAENEDLSMNDRMRAIVEESELAIEQARAARLPTSEEVKHESERAAHQP